MYVSNCFFQRPPSSSLSYVGAMNDDVRSPGSGSTPGPLSQQPPHGLDTDPGKLKSIIDFVEKLSLYKCDVQKSMFFRLKIFFKKNVGITMIAK